MVNARPDLTKALQLAQAGRHAAVIDYLGAWPEQVIMESPALSLAYGTAQARLGRHREGTEWVDSALTHARALGEREIETRALNTRGAIAFVSGRIDEASEYFTRAMLAASRDEDHGTIGRCSNNLGSINNLRGRYTESIGCYNMAVAAFRRAKLSQGVAEALHNLGIAYREQGEHQRALREAQFAIDEAKASGDLALVAMAVRGKAEILIDLGDIDLARECIEQAIRSHRELGDVVEEAQDLRILAGIQAASGAPATAEATLRDVIARASGHGRPLLTAEAHRDLAHLVRSLGRTDEALTAARAALALFEQLGAEAEIRRLDSHEWGYPLSLDLRHSLQPLHEAQRLADQGRYAELVTCLRERPFEELEQSTTLALLNGIGHARLGRLDDAQRWVLIALSKARAVGDRAVEVRALNAYGAIALERGGIDAAVEFFMKAQAEAMREGDLVTVARSANNLGIVASMQGDYGRAIGSYTTAIAAYQRVAYDRGVVESHHNLGIAYHEQGDIDSALDAAERAVQAAETLGDVSLRAQAIAGRAEIRVTRGDSEMARREVERATKVHQDLGDEVRVTEDRRILARSLAAVGVLPEAEEILRDVIRRATDQGRPLLVAATQRDLAHVLLQAGRPDEADHAAREAREAFERLGARAEVKKIDEFLGGGSIVAA